MEEEVWKEFYFNNAQYWASNLGRIKGKRGLLTQHLRYDGYPIVTLGGRDKNGKLLRQQKPVHRIIAMVFLPNPNNLSDVNHINFDRTDNRVCNLEWISHADNIRHSYKHGKHKGRQAGEKNNKAKLTEEQVIEIRQKYNSGEMTKDELAIKYDISLSTINSVINRKTWKHI